MEKETYTPAPLDTSGEVLPEALTSLVEALAKNVHEVWAQSRLAEGWRYGERRDDALFAQAGYELRRFFIERGSSGRAAEKHAHRASLPYTSL